MSDRVFTTYDIATGRVRRIVDGDFATVDANVQPGCGAIPGCVDRATSWVDHATGEVRDLLPMQVEIAGLVVTGLPDGATINGVPAEQWLPPVGEIAPRVLIEAPHHVPLDLVLKDYRAHRAEAYPAAGEQLGALVKAVQAMQSGKAPPADAAAVLDRIADVKRTIPKG